MGKLWFTNINWRKISEYCHNFSVEPILCGSIIMAESGGDNAATRFEPRWKYFYKEEEFAKSCNITVETEKVHQATSWGMFQIMGSCVRELEYRGPLSKLSFDEDYACFFSIKKLAGICKKYASTADRIATWNAGSPRIVSGLYSNQDYVDRVLLYYNNLYLN